MDLSDFPIGGVVSIESRVRKCLAYYEKRDIPALQQSLFELYQQFNRPGGGAKITNFKHKDQLCECFTMMLNYDWMHDPDFREVWAENGFYCIVTYLNREEMTYQDWIAGALDLFLLLQCGEKDLYPKLNDILQKAQIRANMIGGEEARIFSESDFRGGVPYLLRQFRFCAATILSKVEKQHPEIISSSLRPAFERAKVDFEFATIPLDAQLAKMNFFAKIIGRIIEDCC